MYFLPFYAILRSILQKEQGIIIMFVSMLVFLLLPLLSYSDQTKANRFKPISRKIFWFFLFNLFFLGF
jgi:quinol-cytochrome oxidoreductase complex cytochrome b subunit